ncbi:MAG: transposase [Planctomycetes bacterium]|nr:transposase [Planctomycetota bacterium]
MNPIAEQGGQLDPQSQGQVTFWARTGVTAGGDRDDRQPVTLPGREFVRLWSLHILPKGFVKTRRFGGYSNRQRQQFLQAYQELVPAVASGEPPATADPATPGNGSETELTVPSCPHCGARMNCIASRCRDGWSIIMTDVHRPRWYLDGS